jgi:hypothetical protein
MCPAQQLTIGNVSFTSVSPPDRVIDVTFLNTKVKAPEERSKYCNAVFLNRPSHHRHNTIVRNDQRERPGVEVTENES